MPEFFSAFINLFQESVDLVDPLFKMTPAHQSLEQMGELAIEFGYKYMAILDCDTTYIPPKAMQQLMAAKKDVVMAHSFHRGFPFAPAVKVLRKGFENTDAKGPMPLESAEDIWPNQGLKKVWIGAFQLVLIKTKVLKKVPKPWFQHNPVAGVDWYFYQKCKDNGIDVWCDTNLQVDHHNISVRTMQHYKDIFVELRTRHVDLKSM